MPLIKDTIDTILKAIKAIWDFIWPVLRTTVETTWTLIKSAVSGALNVILGLFKTIMQLINGDWSGAWETLKATANTLLETIKSLIGNALNVVLGLFKSIMASAKIDWESSWASIKSTASEKIEGAKSDIEAALKAIPGFFTTHLSTAVSSVKTKFGEIVSAAGTGLGDLVAKITGFLGNIVGAILAPFQSAKDTLTNPNGTMAGLISGVTSFFAGLPGAIMTALVRLPAAITQPFIDALAFLVGKERADAAIQAGKDFAGKILSGLVAALSNAGAAIWDALRGALNTAIGKIPSSIRTFLGINFIEAATGFSGMVTEPTLFLAGERGSERVDISPAPLGESSGPKTVFNLTVPNPIGSLAELASTVKMLQMGVR
jgi:phage-related protein